MSQILPLLNLILPFFSIIALGFLIGKWKRFPEAGLQWMNFFIIYVALPPLFFRLIADKPVGELLNWPFIFIVMLSTYTTFAIAFVYGMWGSRGDIPQAVMQGVAGAYANVGYMGPPLVIEALGQGASAPVAIVFVCDIVLLFTLVPLLMATAGADNRGLVATLLDTAKKILTHPFNIAAGIGLIAAFLQWQPPGWIDRTTAWLAGASAPAALFVLGLTVALRPSPFRREVPVMVVIKLIIHPLIIWFLLSWFGDFNQTWSYAAVLMAALPPALTSFVFATQYGVGAERASAVILFGTIASVVTLTLLLGLMKSGVMPHDLFPQAR
ncbi:MAG: AEC family transporter [Beijerinckiaceae bacterium]